MEKIIFEWVEGRAPGFEGARTVREKVFVQEQGFRDEFDTTDDEAWHLVGYEDGAPFCTARLFFDSPGRAHFGRIAVLPHMRGGGLGLKMLEHMVDKAANLGAQSVVLSAQADKQGFYEKADFTATGATSMDEGVPHVEMERIL